MLGVDIATILFQTGTVGVFIWFVLVWSDRLTKAQQERDNQLQRFFAEQRISDREIMSELVVNIRRLSEQIDQHDQKVDKAIIQLQSRSRSRPTARK